MINIVEEFYFGINRGFCLFVCLGNLNPDTCSLPHPIFHNKHINTLGPKPNQSSISSHLSTCSLSVSYPYLFLSEESVFVYMSVWKVLPLLSSFGWLILLFSETHIRGKLYLEAFISSLALHTMWQNSFLWCFMIFLKRYNRGA